MLKSLGKVQLSGEKTITWNFEGEQVNKDCRSSVLYVPKVNKNVFFAVFLKQNTKSGTVFLYHDHGDDPEKNYNLNIILRYKNEAKELNVKTEHWTIGGKYDYNEIEDINVEDLLEIIFIINKVLTSKYIQVSTGPDENELEDAVEKVETERDNEIKTRGPDENELEDGEEKVETERDNEIKTRGEAALITSLKNVFLNQEDSDVVIKVGDQNYPAHKVIIRARSSVFDKMLKHDMVEKNKGVIDIPDCEPHVFKVFLLYIYAGKLDNVNNENVFELYQMSDKYDVKELRMECVDFLMNNLSTDIICDAIFLATRHHEPSLLALATKFFITNAKEIVLTVKWQNFMKENPVEANELFVKFINKDSTQ